MDERPIPSAAWAMRHVSHHADLAPSDRLVLLLLTEYEDSCSGYCSVSLSKLARRCGLDRRTTMRALGRLRDAGLLSWETRGTARGVNRYRLHIAETAA